MRTRACALVAVVALSGAACVTDRPVTWEDLGFSKAEPKPPAERPKDEAPHVAGAAEAPRADKASAEKASADKASADKAAPEKANDDAAPPQSAQRADEAVDLTPRGRVALPGVAHDSVVDGALVDVEALSLVCVADARALTETAAVFARLDEEAAKVGATLGGARLIRLGRDPARSTTDPPPRACRALLKDAALKAPLARELEPRSTWLVTASSASVVDDSARASARVIAGAHKVTGAPRVVVDEGGTFAAVAIPVERAQGGS